MVAGEADVRPFFSIGVTTFNRHQLLRQTLNSILDQTFSDFEVIVGNDYTEELLSGEMLGIIDQRIRFVNHPENLREVGNMNALLGMATGRYFTWLFDDDLYEPGFLEIAYDYLSAAGFPSAYFCSYRIAPEDELSRTSKIKTYPMREFSGREFLSWYSVFRIKLFPTFGLFDTTTLRNRVGGFEELSNSAIALYSEYLFLAKCGLLDRIIYVDAPLYLYRLHEGSWSESNTDLDNYLMAGKNLIRCSSKVLSCPELAEDYSENLLKICSLHLIEFAHKLGRHVHYIAEHVKKEFGIKAVCRVISGHWHEALKTRKLYLELGGGNGLRCSYEFLKVLLFCNYLMTSHFFHYFRSGRKD